MLSLAMMFPLLSRTDGLSHSHSPIRRERQRERQQTEGRKEGAKRDGWLFASESGATATAAISASSLLMVCTRLCRSQHLPHIRSTDRDRQWGKGEESASDPSFLRTNFNSIYQGRRGESASPACPVELRLNRSWIAARAPTTSEPTENEGSSVSD